MLKRNVSLKAQIVRVRKEHSEKFMEAYHRATGVFNNFYGPLLMTANNAFNEAFDLYEGTPKFRFQVKKAFKDAAKEYDKFWACVRFIFDDRYSVYVDYCATAVEQVWQDVMKLYWVVRGSLLKQEKPDTERLAWVFTAHLLITEAKKLHAKWCISIAEQSGYPDMPKCFEWACPNRLESLIHDLTHAVCDFRRLELAEDVLLALEIIERHLVSHKYQDTAAMKTLSMEDYKTYHDELADDLAYFEKRMADEEREQREANEAYWRRKEEEARKPVLRDVEPDLSVLQTKYNVKPLNR